MALINSISLGFFGFLSLPTLNDLFDPTQSAATITVKIGAGGKNSSFLGSDPGGDCPSVILYDGNGAVIGVAAGSSRDLNDQSDTTTGIQNDGFQTLKVTGSQAPEYMKLLAFGDDAVCVAWVEVTSAASDFHTWNGAMAETCGLPWYPSTNPFPTDAAQFRPPCFWMSDDGRFVNGFSARLFDFAFPDSVTANATSTQWINNPDTLCEAPARQQFWTGTDAVACIPHYPSGNLPQKNADGTDADYDYVKNGYEVDCISPGIPFNDITLNSFLIDGKTPVAATVLVTVPPDETAVPTLPPDATLQNSLDLGSLARRSAVEAEEPAPTPQITEPPTLEPQVRSIPASEVKVPRNAPVIQRRVEHREANPHQWCDEGKLVISQHAEHRATYVCESGTSWGPDFVAVAEGFYCDMCARKVYPLCIDTVGDINTYGTEATYRVAATATGAPQAGNTTATARSSSICFDIKKQRLRLPSRARGDGSGTRYVYGKKFEHVAEWK